MTPRDFEPVIGLEIHVQLKTKTKIRNPAKLSAPSTSDAMMRSSRAAGRIGASRTATREVRAARSGVGVSSRIDDQSSPAAGAAIPGR